MSVYKPVIFGIFVSVILGLFSLFSIFFGFLGQIILGTIAIILGGLVAAYTTDGNNIDGGVHGAISGIISGSLLGVLILTVTFHDPNVIAFVGGIVFGGIVFGFNFGIVGAVIGNIIKKRSLKTINDNGFLVCNKCKSYYKLNEGEFPEDYDNECDCGGKIEYKKSNKPKFKLILHYNVFGVGVILAIIGIIMVNFVFQSQIEDMLRISCYILVTGVLAISLSIIRW